MTEVVGLSEADVIALLSNAIWLTAKLSGPILIVGMAVGLVVSVVQTTTSIQEQTLTFVPKLAAIVMTIAVFSGWMIQLLVDYTKDIFTIISKL